MTSEHLGNVSNDCLSVDRYQKPLGVSFPKQQSFGGELWLATERTKKQKLPCNVLKMAKRYKNKILTGPQAKKANPQVRPSKNVRLIVPLRSCRIVCRRVFRLWEFMEFS